MHTHFLAIMKEAIMSILDFFRKRKAAQPQAEKETRAVPLEQCDIAIADRV